MRTLLADGKKRMIVFSLSFHMAYSFILSSLFL